MLCRLKPANGNTVQMQYDIFGRLTNTIDAIQNTITFEYDKNGNQTALIDGNGNRTQFTYDGLSRKTSTIYPGGTHEDAQYDLVGNRITRTDCNGAQTVYYYNMRNQLYSVLYRTDDRARDYYYDPVGNLMSVIERDASWNIKTNACISYTYDALNRVTSETSVGVTHQYKYDLNGNRTNAVYGVTGRSVDWTYDDLNRIDTIVEGNNTTQYYYDLNSKPVMRFYPNNTGEYRTFDARGRLLTMNTSISNGSFTMTYEYDAVGSARKMTQTSNGLTNQAQDAVTTWEYDDRYRLTSEAVITVAEVPDLGSTNTTHYTWDNADNRLSKTNYVGGSLASTTVYSTNALNQMTGYVAEAPGLGISTNVVFTYDDNGNRTNKTITIGGSQASSTGYTYDEDNRLVSVATGSTASSLTPHSFFAYDYRSRRYYRETPATDSSTNHMYSVFDGGLSIQEYESDTLSLIPSPLTLRTEFIRGEGMGGGVGGMVYSIQHTQVSGLPSQTSILCSHANHRGDVIARSDGTGSLTSFALYEAYGKRIYEWSDGVTGDPDRQKANTKEEETDLGLLNEGFRFRDLETGVFLTRDPIGYGDGPNVYCYVHCNPITRIDALGLLGGNADYYEAHEVWQEMHDAGDYEADFATFLNEMIDSGDLPTRAKLNRTKAKAADARGEARKASDAYDAGTGSREARDAAQEAAKDAMDELSIMHGAGLEYGHSYKAALALNSTFKRNSDVLSQSLGFSDYKSVMSHISDKYTAAMTELEQQRINKSKRLSHDAYVKGFFNVMNKHEQAYGQFAACVDFFNIVYAIGATGPAGISFLKNTIQGKALPSAASALKALGIPTTTYFLQNAWQINSFGMGFAGSYFPGCSPVGAGASGAAGAAGEIIGTGANFVTDPEGNGL